MDPHRRGVFHSIKKHLVTSQAEELIKHFSVVIGFNGLAAILLFLFHIITTRMLGPERYSVVGTAFAILYLFYIMFSIIGIVLNHFISYYKTRYQYEKINYLTTYAIKALFFAGVSIFFLITVFSNPIKDFFHFNSPMTAVMIGLTVWFTMMSYIYEGVFIGLHKYNAIGLFRVLEAGLRIAFVVVFLTLGAQENFAILSLALGTILALIICYGPIYEIQKLKFDKVNLKEIFNFAKYAFIALICYSIMINIDGFVAKHVFDAATAGSYLAGAVLAKVPFFVSLILGGVMFSKVTRLYANGKKTSKILQNSLLYTTIVSLGFAVVLTVLPDKIFSIFYGGDYAFGSLLGLYALGFGLLGITIVLVLYALAVRKFKLAIIPPLFTILSIMIFSVFNVSFTVLVIKVFALAALFCAVLLYAAQDVIDFDLFISKFFRKPKHKKYISLKVG